MGNEIICDCCGEEIYAGEGYYYVSGQVICPDCAGAYARELLQPYRVGDGRG